MEKKIQVDELRAAIRKMARGKSPGPDCIPAEFYIEFTDMIADSLTHTLNEAHDDHALPHTFLEGEISILYKKGDPRDMKNYRPITLLNADYKLMTKILAIRLQAHINHIISPPQNGFVPGRSIFDNFNVSQLIQAYIDETDGEGLIIFLDIEKAFDTVSWAYMKMAMRALNVGPRYSRWVEMMYNPDNAPKRRVKVNGDKGTWFELQSGVAQGCPLSALLFLFVTEAFTRAIITDDTLKGITVNGNEIKISQFADDTGLYLSHWSQLTRMWTLLKELAEVTGLSCNRNKTEGMRLGTLKKYRCNLEAAQGIQWVQPGQWIRTLGFPIGESFSIVDYYTTIYNKTKRLLVGWSRRISGMLTVYGRAQIANSLIYSRFRYPAMAIAVPKTIMAAIDSDVSGLIWNRDHTFDPDALGTDQDRPPLFKAGTEILPKGLLGLGLLPWEAHVDALSIKILIRYLDASTGDWKLLLDAWLARTPEGRGAILTTYTIGDLTRSNSYRVTHLPRIYHNAINALRKLTPIPMRAGEVTTKEEGRAEPLWESLRIKMGTFTRRHKEMWRETFDTNTVGDIIDHSTGTCILTAQEAIDGWVMPTGRIDTSNEYYKITSNTWIKLRTIHTQWNSIIEHVPTYLTRAACSSTERLIGAGMSENAHAMMHRMGWKGHGIGKNEDGTINPIEAGSPIPHRQGLGSSKKKTKTKGAKPNIKLYEVNGRQVYADGGDGIRKIYILDPLGIPTRTDDNLGWTTTEGKEPLWWGKGVKGDAEFSYPHPKGWTLAQLHDSTPLDSLDVSTLTKALAQHRRTTPSCIQAWNNYRSSWNVKTPIDWYELGTIFTNALGTTRDTHLFAKFIIHRHFPVRSICPSASGSDRCRCCGKKKETHNHLYSCNVLYQIFKGLRRAVSSLWMQTPHTPEMVWLAMRTDGGFLPPVFRILHVIIWKCIIIGMTKTELEGTPFNNNHIMKMSIMRLNVRIAAIRARHEQKVRKAVDRMNTPPSSTRTLTLTSPILTQTDDCMKWSPLWIHECSTYDITLTN